MNIYLAKLQEKPIPNIKQKLGINVNLPHKKDEIEEEVKEEEPEIVEEDGADETKETEKLRILHQSKHFIVIDKPFDVIINSDEPDRVSVHSLLKDQFPDLTNDNLKVSTYLHDQSCKW